jgi:hypothetical protein
MPSQYNGFCYPTLTEAASEAASQPALAVSDGLVLTTGFSSINETAKTAVINYRFNNTTNTAYQDLTVTKTFVSCDTPGPTHNYSGLSLIDVTEISFGVVLVWVIAFGYKSMNRTVYPRI